MGASQCITGVNSAWDYRWAQANVSQASTQPGTTVFTLEVPVSWGISSVGLEHLPCTQGVKGSSPLFSTGLECKIPYGL